MNTVKGNEVQHPMYNNFSPYPTFGAGSSYDQISRQMITPNGNPYQQPYQPNTNITFVNGMEGAKAYQLSPNSQVILMDSENSKFYVKSTDNLGVPKLSSYSFTEDEIPAPNNQQQALPPDMVAVKNEDLTQIIAKLNELDGFKNTVESKLKDLL